MNTITVPSVDVLRNRGIQVEVHSLDTDEHGKHTRRTNDSGEFVYEQIWVKFDNWTIANLEQPAPTGFGDLDGWEQELEIRATSAVLKTFALIEEKYRLDPATGQMVPDVRWAALRLKDSQNLLYGLALTSAMFMANGIEAEVAGEVLRRSLKETVAAIREGNDKASKALEDMGEKEQKDSTTPTDPNPNEDAASAFAMDSGHELVEAQTSTGG